jgi:transposase
VRSVIPARVGRPSGGAPAGRWRRLMRRYRDHRYGQRWQAETVVSMIKRRQGGYVLGRSDASRGRELSLKVLTHNVMINAAA